MTQSLLTRSYYALVVLTLLLALQITWHPAPGPLLQQLNGLVYDLLVVPEQPEDDSRIVIVDVDEQSLQTVGRWPWPRQTLAQLIEALQQQQPAVIGLDFLLPEPAVGDPLLKAQLAARNVITPITYGLKDTPSAPLIHNTIGLSPSLHSPSATTLAHITPSYDPDGTIRQLYPVLCTDRCTRTLSLQMLETLTHQNAVMQDASSLLDTAQLCAGPYCQALDDRGAVWVPYQHWKNMRHIPAAALLNGDRFPELAGSMVLVGTSAVGLGDNVTTPISPDTPGVRIHANLLAAWFDRIQWVPLPQQASIITLILLLWGGLAACWPHAGSHLKGAILVVAGTLFSLPLLASQQGYWLNPLPAGLLLSVSLIAMASYSALQAFLQRRQLYRTFGRYVPESVLRELMTSDTAQQALRPQRKEITVLFADIQGFTPLSAQLSPELLEEMTNRLFTELTDEIHKHQGTLDKFMGDAVMAFWNAPLSQPDHAERALDCALQLQQRVKALRPWLEAHNLAEIRLSIALESGTVTVGNMGSRQRQAYTALGHPVNLAAHLQGMHKEIGHNLLTGPNLSRRLGQRIQPLGHYNIRGVDRPQPVGTAHAENQPVTPAADPPTTRRRAQPTRSEHAL